MLFSRLISRMPVCEIAKCWTSGFWWTPCAHRIVWVSFLTLHLKRDSPWWGKCGQSTWAIPWRCPLCSFWSLLCGGKSGGCSGSRRSCPASKFKPKRKNITDTQTAFLTISSDYSILFLLFIIHWFIHSIQYMPLHVKYNKIHERKKIIVNLTKMISQRTHRDYILYNN